MCGIVGYIDYRGENIQSKIELMTRAISHRGPDAQGIQINQNVALGHTRLSIIDLSNAGSQPMKSGNGNAIVFNGEIYNYKNLKKELEPDFKFNSNSDTETILHQFTKSGFPELPNLLDGMFAFAIHQVSEHKLYLCRDRFGQKPLYYSSGSGYFCFASEIEALYAVLRDSLTLNLNSLDYYLSELSTDQPNSIWNEIKQLPPGHYLTLDTEHQLYKLNQYYQIPVEKIELTENEIIEKTEHLLISAIEKRTLADVPIAAFLSGGIDSGLINAILASKTKSPYKAFTIAIKGEENEAETAAQISKKYGIDHLIKQADITITERIPEIIQHFGEPFSDQSMLPTWIVCGEMAKERKVALSGDGGDEIFGGYHEYVWSYLADQFQQKHPARKSQVFHAQLSKVKSRFGVSQENDGHLLTWINKNGAEKLHRQMGFSFNQKDKLYKGEQRSPAYAKEKLNEIWNNSTGNNITEKLFSSSLNTRLINDYLVKVDRMSMYHGLEVRNPFLDKDLVAFAMNIPSAIKLKNGTSKYILRQLAKKYLGKTIAGSKKRGFGIPLSEWLRDDLKIDVKEALMELRFTSNVNFQEGFINQILNEHQLKKVDHTDRIWTLYCLAIWNRKFKGL